MRPCSTLYEDTMGRWMNDAVNTKSRPLSCFMFANFERGKDGVWRCWWCLVHEQNIVALGYNHVLSTKNQRRMGLGLSVLSYRRLRDGDSKGSALRCRAEPPEFLASS